MGLAVEIRNLSIPASTRVAFTFDDGPHSDITNVLPILNAKGILASFCLVEDLLNGLLIGGAGGYDWTQALALQSAGHEIICHSKTHGSLTGQTMATYQTEIVDPLPDFQAHGIFPTGFCWPGSASDATARGVAAQHYRYALGDAALTAPNLLPFDTFHMHRVAFTNTGTLAGYKNAVNVAIASGGFLIFIVHAGYDLDATQQGYLGQTIDYIQSLAIPIQTVTQALNVLAPLPGLSAAGTNRITIKRPTPQIIIPAYVYPGAPPRTVWDAWINAADPVSHIIANPGSPGGPGTFTDTNYQAVIAQAQAKGITILGYVDTSYTQPDISTPTLDAFNTGPSQSVWLRTGFRNGALIAGDSAPSTDAAPTYADCPSAGIWYSFSTTAQLAMDQEVRETLGSVVGDFQLVTRYGAAGNGYYAEVLASGAISINTLSLGAHDLTLATGTHTPLAGEEFMFRSAGDWHALWCKIAGVWTKLLEVNDASYRQTGYGGWRSKGPHRIDSVAGGVVGTLQRQQIDSWFALYGIRDIFFDQAASGASDAPFYQSLANYVRSTQGAQVMMNPGTTVDESYAAAADILCVFEGTEATYASYVPSAWNAAYPRSKFCHLVYNAASVASTQADMDQAVSQNAGYLHVVDTNVWFAQSAFFAAEVAKLRTNSGAIGEAGAANFSLSRPVASGAIGQNYLGQHYVGYGQQLATVTQGETIVASGTATITITPSEASTNVISEAAVCVLVLTMVGISPEQSVITFAVSASAVEQISDPGDLTAIRIDHGVFTPDDLLYSDDPLLPDDTPVYGTEAIVETATQPLVFTLATVGEQIQVADVATFVIAESDVDLENDAGLVTFTIAPSATAATTDAGLQRVILPYWIVCGAPGQSYVGSAYLGQIFAPTHGVETIVDSGTCTLSIVTSAAETLSEQGANVFVIVGSAVGFDGGTVTLAILAASVAEQLSDAGTATFAVLNDGTVGGSTSLAIAPSAAVEATVDIGTFGLGIDADLISPDDLLDPGSLIWLEYRHGDEAFPDDLVYSDTLAWPEQAYVHGYEVIEELVVPDIPAHAIITGALGQSYIGQNYLGETIAIIPAVEGPARAPLFSISASSTSTVIGAAGAATASFTITAPYVARDDSPGDTFGPGDMVSPAYIPGAETIVDQGTVALSVSATDVHSLILAAIGTCTFTIAVNTVQASVISLTMSDAGTAPFSVDGIASESLTDVGTAVLVVTPVSIAGDSGTVTLSVSAANVAQTLTVPSIATFTITPTALWFNFGTGYGQSQTTKDRGRRLRNRYAHVRLEARRHDNPWHRDRVAR